MAKRAVANPSLEFNGRLVEDSTFEYTIASFPGVYEREFKEQVQRYLGVSSACVFFPDVAPNGQPHRLYGHHQDPCHCGFLYGGSPPWGCLWFRQWQMNVQRALGQKRLVVVFSGRDGDVQSLGNSQKGELRYIRDVIQADFEGVDMDGLRQLLAPYQAKIQKEALESLSRDLKARHISACAVDAALQKDAEFSTLDIGGKLFGRSLKDRGATAVAQALVPLDVSSVIMSWHRISNAGSKALADMLIMNTALTSVDLSWNKIGPVGAQAIASALRTSRVSTLNLCWNKIGNGGAEAISEALVVNRRLHTLGLSYNVIGGAGTRAIAEALRVNTTLTILALRSNDIASSSARIITEALKTNAMLREINQANEVGSQTAPAHTAVFDALTPPPITGRNSTFSMMHVYST
mmetsp:Transcript_11392/g.25549  ORF Transcript_11392/g.25549 Transcript_11392/m.25549 type:complete len:407 (+) Transcript_11392:112-1332(+)